MRIRPLWLWRVALLGFAVAYLANAGLRDSIPPLIPFLGAAVVEAQFFLQGARAQRGRRPVENAGPQERDLEELGWASRTVTVSNDDTELVLRPGEMSNPEINAWLSSHREEIAALGPGRHELAPIENPESPLALRPPEPVAPRSSRLRTRLVQALVVVAVFGGAVFLDLRNQHWQRLSASTKAATVAVLDRQASRIAGHPATVICDTSGRHVGYVQDADGLAEVGGRRAWLTPQVCYQLYKILHTARAHGTASGHAIAVLAHEAWHLHGEPDEARANCFAYQSGVHVGEALGLAPSTARDLMHQQLAMNSSEFADTPAYIVPAGCHRGGSLDLHLDDGHFP